MREEKKRKKASPEHTLVGERKKEEVVGQAELSLTIFDVPRKEKKKKGEREEGMGLLRYLRTKKEKEETTAPQKRSRPVPNP